MPAEYLTLFSSSSGPITVDVKFKGHAISIARRFMHPADIDKLVRFGKAPVDEPNVRRWAREWGVETRLDAALETARR